MTKIQRKIRFAPISLANRSQYVSEDSKEMKKNCEKKKNTFPQNRMKIILEKKVPCIFFCVVEAPSPVNPLATINGGSALRPRMIMDLIPLTNRLSGITG